MNNRNTIKKNELLIIYDNIFLEEKVRIFGEQFVKNNKDNCLLFIEDNIFRLKEFYENINQEEKLKIILIEEKNINDMSYMFYNCEYLTTLPDLSYWKTNNVTNISYMFYNCKSLSSLPDLSYWKTDNVTNISYMFYNCKYLSSLPEISKWNTYNIINISNIFSNCESLSSLSNIS